LYQLGFAGSWETRLWLVTFSLSRGPSHGDEGGVRNRETGTTREEEEEEEEEEGGWGW
jgi:hypothetical protein